MSAEGQFLVTQFRNVGMQCSSVATQFSGHNGSAQQKEPAASPSYLPKCCKAAFGKVTSWSGTSMTRLHTTTAATATAGATTLP